MEKTNAIRIVEQKKLKYKVYEYPHVEGEFQEGSEVAKLLNENPLKVFKTIVLTFQNKYYVCMIPVNDEIDLKKAAKAFGIKSIEMLPVKELFNLTGYIRGGCSPIGMKKLFRTIIDSSASNFNEIIFSAGKIGFQLELEVTDLVKLVNASLVDIKRC